MRAGMDVRVLLEGEKRMAGERNGKREGERWRGKEGGRERDGGRDTERWKVRGKEGERNRGKVREREIKSDNSGR